MTLAAWAASGSPGFRRIPDLLERLSEIQSERSYSFVGMADDARSRLRRAGRARRSSSAARCSWAASCFARRGDEERSFTCAVAATLALSPIVWLHYLVVLLVPMAIARPRFSVALAAAGPALGEPEPGYAEGFQTFMPAIVAAILVAVLLARPRPRADVVAGLQRDRMIAATLRREPRQRRDWRGSCPPACSLP